MPTFYKNEDIPFLLQDAGVWIEIAGAPRLKGLVDYASKEYLQTLQIAGISGTAITAVVQTTALPAPLANRTALVVDGQPMILRDAQQEGDGALTILLCERPPA